MPLVNALPFRLRPRGTSDTLDGSNTPPGSMANLTNLIFDPSTPFCFVPRPAGEVISEFPGFSTPGVISAAMVIGTIIYGMIGSAATPTYDQPFAYDIPSNTFLTVSGTQDATTLPLTQATTGFWVPPDMDTTGIYVVVTHPGFGGGAGPFFGWFDITNPVAPVWHAGNTGTNTLPAVPSAVIQFNSRLYFAVNNQAWFTDALTLVITAATQELTIGDSTDIIAFAPLALSTTQQGVLQAILAFKGNHIAQITGDASDSTLAVNDLPSSVGSYAPRSIKATPLGVAFMAVDGLRRVRLDGSVTEPNSDIRVPFINAATPSRVSAAYNAGVYRICVQNNDVVGTPFQEWWFDEVRNGWTGPHTFRQDLILEYSNTFIAFDTSNPAKMYRSDPTVNALTGYDENGSTLLFRYLTSPMPDKENLMANSTVLSTINALIPAGSSGLSFVGLDDTDSVLSTANIDAPAPGSIWGAFLWGGALWGGQASKLRPYTIPWLDVLVFTKLTVQITGACATGYKLSNLQVMYQPLGYVPP